jgi:hypothetical protein
MPAVLTTSSTLKCAHGGTLQVQASTSQLSAAGSPVLVEADLLAATIPDCPNKNPVAGLLPCVTVTSVLLGQSTNLAVAGQAVLLENATGLTSSTPPGTWQVVSAGQTVLEAM